ncbi:Protein-tyrosine phosphatase [Dictyocaulus viviparus]|uniref:Protein-tyrosine phosphatase n=1 Tax=Dictyocaulus viviparus TaxID=29172 RepID=A0A0D8XL74_DICVI|nr:Protein-tyrosine phosphatase [Dictyocaulus viviparus]
MERSKLGKLPKFRRRSSSMNTTVTTTEDDGTQVERRAKKTTRRSTSRMNGPDQATFKEAFKLFCERTLKTGVMPLADEFLKLKMATQSIGSRPKTACDANPDKNRYREVFCIDATRVILTWPAGFCDYINANWVTGVDKQKKFICTQGPVNKTVDDFWRMIWQEKCRSIVMLCNITECGKPKCEQYWPLTAESPMKLASGLTVKFISTDAIETSVELTKIEVSDETGVQHTVEHFHWTDWPDRGVPKSTTLAIFRMLRKVNRLTPCVVHCSAGIGRTGTVVGIDMIYRRLERGEKDVTLLKVVTELREMRHGAVQMDCQYVYMHRILLVVAENLKIITPAETEKFQRDYEQLLKSRGFL